MAINLTSPVTGGAQTGLTSPTYTIVDDVAPTSLGKQKAVTALGGTQVGVTVHTASSPFTITSIRPAQFRMPGLPGPDGLIRNVPRNVVKLIARKGVVPAVGQPPQTMLIEVSISTPAGAETYDAANVRAALSLIVGSLNQVSAGVGDTVVSGIM